MSGRLYKLEPRDTSGVFLGLSVAQAVLLGIGFGGAILLRLVGAPVLAAGLVLLSCAALAKLRINGRHLHQWLSVLAGWGLANLAGRRRWRGSLPLLPAGSSKPDLPPVLSGLDIIELEYLGRQVGLVRDKRTASLTVVVPVRPAQFAGAEDTEQDALLGGWGDVLSAYTTPESPVTLIGWSHQTTSSDLAEHCTWVEEKGVLPSDPYDELLDDVAALAIQHETVVWITVSGRNISGKGMLLDRAAAAVPSQLDALTSALDNAGLFPDHPLSVTDLWRSLRQRCDPIRRSDGEAPRSLAERMGLAPPGPVPLAMDVAWDDVRIDGTCHRVAWVETWPRRPVPADWLTSFLVTEWATLTLLHRPIDPARSMQRIDSQLTKLAADRDRKEDKGRRITETDRRTEEAVHDLEGDLVSGHGEVLYLGLVTVSAATPDELEDRWSAVERQARAAQIGLRILHGRQDVAWAATLPCGTTQPSALEVMGL